MPHKQPRFRKERPHQGHKGHQGHQSHQGHQDSKKYLRVTGFPAVSSLFANAPGRIEKLFFDEKAKSSVGAFCAEMARARKPYRLVEPDELARIAGTILHGGIVALAEPRPVRDFDPKEALKWARENQVLLALDGVSNPHNLGAIVRTSAFFGVPRILISDHPAQAQPSDASYRVAEGGMEYVDLYRARNFTDALKKLRESHRIVGTAAEGGQPLENLKRSDRPFALIFGNEEDGIPKSTLKACDDIITIPGSGFVQSLNVSATAAILIHGLSALQRR